jgi:hypothetical protein
LNKHLRPLWNVRNKEGETASHVIEWLVRGACHGLEIWVVCPDWHAGNPNISVAAKANHIVAAGAGANDLESIVDAKLPCPLP